MSLYTSIAVAVVLGLWRLSVFEIHQGVLVAVGARCVMPPMIKFFELIGYRQLSDAVTEALKNRVGAYNRWITYSFLHALLGRLRPDFLDRCQWDAALKQFTGFV